MSLVERFAPPPGAPGAVRAGAAHWRETAGRLLSLTDERRGHGASLSAGWWGPAKEAFVQRTWPFLATLEEGAQLLRGYADGLDELAGAIDQAQQEYHQRVLAVGLTVVGGVLLTPLTLTASDEVAAAAVSAELATVTQIAATAAEQVMAVLAGLAARTAALAGRWAALAALDVSVDAVSAAVVRHDGAPLAHLHLADDARFALVGALAVPLGAGLLAGVRGVGLGVLGGAAEGAAGLGARAAGVGARLAAGGVSVAAADALVRAALRQGIDPGELAMAALPIGPAAMRRGGAERTFPMGFADEAAFEAFGVRLTEGLHAAGYRDVVQVFQGSAVTGVKFTTGQPFDVGRVSDFDIALASPALLRDAKAAGVPLRQGGARSAPLGRDVLQVLGLADLTAQLSVRAGRDVHFMVYRDLTTVLQRSGGIRVR